MKRRAFVACFGAVLAAPLVAEGQRARQLSRVGVLTAGLPDDLPEVAFFVREAAPRISRVAVFSNLDNIPDRQQLDALRDVGARVGVAIVPIAVRTANDYRIAFESAEAQSADAIMIVPSPLNIRFRSRVVEFAARRRQPTMDAEESGPHAGMLMSYGPRWTSNFRQAADLVDKILKGAKPADLPVEQPRNIVLVINLKTAKALGLTIPPSLLLRADQVLE